MAVIAAGLFGLSPAAVQAQPAEPIVTISSGPTQDSDLIPECNDAVRRVQTSTSFVLSRDQSTDEVTVELAYDSDATEGVHYSDPPMSATFGAGEATTTVTVSPMVNPDQTRLVALSATVVDGTDYGVGAPASATISFVSERDPSLEPMDCNPQFKLSDAPTNSAQTIAVGEVPVPIEVTGGMQFVVRLLSGSLPTGVSLADIGSEPSSGFIGAATAPGAYTAVLEVCPAGIVFTCRTTTLNVAVLQGDPPPSTTSSPTLPRTGPSDGSLPLALAGSMLLTVGIVLTRSTRRHR